MKALKLIFLALTLLTLGACQQRSSGSQKEVVYREALPTPVAGPRNEGAGDSGGGNGTKGRPFESFSVRPLEDLEVFENQVVPLISRIENFHPFLAADLWHIILNREWYVVPVDLNSLSSGNIGVFIGFESLDQIALQDTEEIWMDGRLFEAMTLEDQKTIILHELIMGVRLLEFSSEKDNCLAQAMRVSVRLTSRDSDKDYGKIRDSCFRRYKKEPWKRNEYTRSSKIKLNKSDYKKIRKFTNQLLENPESLSESEVESILAVTFKRVYAE